MVGRVLTRVLTPGDFPSGQVGGTKGGFFGETVDVKGKYAERGYVADSGSAAEGVPYIGVLIASVVGVLLVTVLVVARSLP